MTYHDPAGAYGRLLSESVDNYGAGKNAPGECLRWCYFAIGAKPNLTPANIAMDAWNNAPAAARHGIGPNTVVPADLPIILGPVSGPRWAGDKTYMDGDVIIARGAGAGMSNQTASTDYPSSGHVGTPTLSQRAAETRRPVLGYLTSWLGYDLTLTASAASAGAVSTPDPNEDDMAIQDRANAAAAIRLAFDPSQLAIVSTQVKAVYQNRLGRDPELQALEDRVALALSGYRSIAQQDGDISLSQEAAKYRAANPGKGL